jgi:hypothetical protein
MGEYGKQKKWWIRFLDEKKRARPMEIKEMMDSLLDGKRSNQWKQKEMVDSLFG